MSRVYFIFAHLSTTGAQMCAKQTKGAVFRLLNCIQLCMTQTGDAKAPVFKIVEEASPDEEVAVLLPQLPGFPSGGIGGGKAQPHPADPAKGPRHVVDGGARRSEDVVDGEEILDEVMVAVMKAPNTYTKEDTIEISSQSFSALFRLNSKLLSRFPT